LETGNKGETRTNNNNNNTATTNQLHQQQGKFLRYSSYHDQLLYHCDAGFRLLCEDYNSWKEKAQIEIIVNY